MPIIKRIKKYGLLGWFFFPTLLHALPSDHLSVIHFQADYIDIQQRGKIILYRGHVHLTQGTTHITVARAITYLDGKRRIQVAIGYGKNDQQAIYQTLLNPGEPPLIAKADIIHYYPQKQMVTLSGHAKISHGQDIYRASYIDYDIKQQHVTSKNSPNNPVNWLIETNNF